MRGYPRGFQPLGYAVVAALVASGLLLAPTTLDVRLGFSVPWRLAGGGRLLVAALHVTAATATALLVGALWSIHMRAGYRRRRNLWSAGVLLALLLVLTVSGIAVLYVGAEMPARALAAAHLIAGCGLPLLALVHVVAGRATARAQHAARHH